jgi:hypothetical protein
MIKGFVLFVFFSCFPVLWAQMPHEPPAGSNEADRRLQQQMFEQWATMPESQRQAIARQEQNEKLREFYTKAQHFVTLWRKFAVDLDSQRTFNAKLAKELSKAFHDMEKSDGWPAGREK